VPARRRTCVCRCLMATYAEPSLQPPQPRWKPRATGPQRGRRCSGLTPAPGMWASAGLPNTIGHTAVCAPLNDNPRPFHSQGKSPQAQRTVPTLASCVCVNGSLQVSTGAGTRGDLQRESTLQKGTRRRWGGRCGGSSAASGL